MPRRKPCRFESGLAHHLDRFEPVRVRPRAPKMQVNIEELGMIVGQKEIEIFVLQKQIQALTEQVKKLTPPTSERETHA